MRSVLMGVLLVACLAGCGGSSGTEGDTTLSCGENLNLMIQDYYDRTGKFPSEQLIASYRSVLDCENG